MKTSMGKLLSLLLAAILVLSVLAGCSSGGGGGTSATGGSGTSSTGGSGKDITAAFTDPVFLAYVRKLLEKKEGEPIFESDVKDIEKVNTNFASILNADGSYTYIQSVAGIEYFTSLKTLVCSRETEIDVSKNPTLEYLSISNLSLTEIDVSKNPNLKHLDCRLNNLTEIDVSNNLALIYLDCGVNKLTEVDVSKNVALEKFHCDRNELTGVDISNNPALTELQCGRNKFWDEGAITGLDEGRTSILWD